MRRSKHKTKLHAGGRSGHYYIPHVCFRCRKSFKRADRPIPYIPRRHRKGGKPAADQRLPAKKCPDCGGNAVALSRKFKPPSRSDVTQWKKVEYLVAHGFRFFSQ